MTEQLKKDWREDRQLVREAQQDPSAFGGLYERYVDRICSFFIHRGNSQQTAEDLTSATFLNALQAFSGFNMKHDYAFAGWIFRIAKNQAINKSREDKRYPKVPLSELEPYLMAPPRSTDPLEHVIRGEQRERVVSVVDQLPPRQKTAILLRFGQDFTHRQVGQIIGKGEGATKTMIFRTLKQIKQQNPELEEVA